MGNLPLLYLQFYSPLSCSTSALARRAPLHYEAPQSLWELMFFSYMLMVLVLVLTTVRKLSKGNRQHKSKAARGPCRNARPESLDEGEVLA
jgi:hypothetical protein